MRNFRKSHVFDACILLHTSGGKYKGGLTNFFKELIGLKGVGQMCQPCVGVADQQAVISVHVRVHRVTNRWSFIQAPSPEARWLS
jgi:endonuclease III